MNRIIFRGLMAIIVIVIASSSAYGLDIEAKMLAQGSAVLQIDGKQRMVRQGQVTPEGVTLVSADGKKAVIEVEGKRQTISLSRSISTQFKTADKTQVRIPSSSGNHYRIKGLIDGKSVDFMVDTGATYIAMSREQADQLSINYSQGKTVSVGTANGVVTARAIELNSVAVGNIVLHQVPALISDAPTTTEILLGNSYLSKVDLKIEQGVMVLTEK